MKKVEHVITDESVIDVTTDGVWSFQLRRAVATPYPWQVFAVEAGVVLPECLDTDAYSNDILERIGCGNYTVVTLCMLIERKHNPVPHTISIVQEFANERIVDPETGYVLTSGVSVCLRASASEFRKWLKPHGPVWTATSPILGDWTLKEFSVT